MEHDASSRRTVTCHLEGHVAANELSIQSEAISRTPFPPMSAQSNTRYNNFQTSITRAAAQAHDAAITRPCEYLGASTKVSELDRFEITYGDCIPCARNS